MRTRPFLLALGLAAILAGCSSSSSGSPSATSAGESTSTTVTVTTASVVNVWKGPPVDPSKLPLGNSKVSLSGPAVGGLWSCSAANPQGGGAMVAGPWIDQAAGTWNSRAKVGVRGSVAWPMAKYDERVTATSRIISSNGVPVGTVTGSFPIARDDPAFAFDRNPNAIAPVDVNVTLPVAPVAASTPSCLGKGTIGVLKNGVSLFAPIDDLNRDAVAYETQDACEGHPQQTRTYHYHDIPSCIIDAAAGPSTVVGYAYDGFPIVVERDANGALPTNADLDQCHGRTSPIVIDGRTENRYHYSATREFPYFIGCFTGTKI